MKDEGSVLFSLLRLASWVLLLLFAAAWLTCGLCVTSILCPGLGSWMNRVPFDPAAWKQAGPEDRYDLAYDLCAGLLDGKTGEEVEELLREPMQKERPGPGPGLHARPPEGGENWY